MSRLDLIGFNYKASCDTLLAITPHFTHHVSYVIRKHVELRCDSIETVPDRIVSIIISQVYAKNNFVGICAQNLRNIVNLLLL